MASYVARKRLKHALKIKAQQRLRNAVASGAVVKIPCVVCGDHKSQGHHPDYAKPLEVIWLCDRHHKEVHGRLIDKPRKKRSKERAK